MRVADPFRYCEIVADRGQVRLINLMQELGVDPRGFFERVYRRYDGKTVVTVQFEPGGPYYEVVMDLGTNRLPPHDGFQPSVVAKEPIPYVITWGSLYEYEPGMLFRWSARRRKKIKSTFRSDQKVLFEVLGRTEQWKLRVRLPHRHDQEWVLADGAGGWLDRRPSQLELRLWHLYLDNPFQEDWRHPLHFVGTLMSLAHKERWLFDYNDELFNVLAIEDWEAQRQLLGLGFDEALVALRKAVLHEDADWGPLSEDLVLRYVAADWLRNAPEELIRQMTHMWLTERRAIRAAMEAVADARQMYAGAVLDQLTAGPTGG